MKCIAADKLNYVRLPQGDWKYRTVTPIRFTFDGFSFVLPVFHEHFTLVGRTIFIHAGYAWDGATCAPDWKFLEASLAHDALFQAIDEDRLPESFRPTANKIFYEVARFHNVGKLHAKIYYFGVRYLGPIRKKLKGK